MHQHQMKPVLPKPPLQQINLHEITANNKIKKATTAAPA